MSHRTWQFRIIDILSAIDKISDYTKKMSFETFNSDQKTVDAVLRNLEIIGEAARFIPSEIKEKRPDISWLAISGLRNVIVHEYFGISVQIIWQTIQEDLPSLKEKLKNLSSSKI